MKCDKNKNGFFVYILKCNDGTLYTGWTVNLEKRISSHSKGIASKYTRVRLPVQLAYFEEKESKNDAMRREYKIKALSRREKLALILSKNQSL